MNLFEMVQQFHKKFLPIIYCGKPRTLPENVSKFRIAFLEEELNEYKKAVTENNIHDQFDALIDLVYVALGTAALHAFDFNAGFNLVHNANMNKILAKHEGESKRGYAYDIIKPPGWVAPNLNSLLEGEQE
jgi:predicted HAD superfamily Cof-like phosphohydrolase